jgi:hypothetical protein
MVTGDSSGHWLARAMYETGFASLPTSRSRDDGLALNDAYITAAEVRATREPAPAIRAGQLLTTPYGRAASARERIDRAGSGQDRVQCLNARQPILRDCNLLTASGITSATEKPFLLHTSEQAEYQHWQAHMGYVALFSRRQGGYYANDSQTRRTANRN